MTDKKKSAAVAYARDMAAWWRGHQWSLPPATADVTGLAADAYRSIGVANGGRRCSMVEIAAAWDRAADLLERGGAS